MQAVLEKQKSNVIQFPSKTVGGDGGGTSTLVPVVKELISSIKTLTGVMIGQAKGSKGATPAKAGAPTDSLNSSLESEVETGRYQETQLNVLKKIEENTRPITAEKVKDSNTDGGLSLGGIASIIAIAAGTFAGLVTAWVKTVKLLVVGIGVGIEKMVVFLSKFFPSLKTILFNIEVTVMLLVENMKGIFKNVVGKIGSIFNGAVDFFKGIFGEGSMIGKVITSIKTAVTGFLEPIIAGFKTISEVSGPIGKAVQFVKNALGSMMEFFAMIGSKLGSFGTLFSAVSKIVSKIAYPLMIIMSIWDTVKGALAGWEEGGFVGAIGGAIKGLFNGLVFGVLDMIKGAISWIAGALGFDAVEEFLDSFSFADMFSSLVDAILFIPQQIQNLIMDGWEEGGFVGAIGGAIKGLLNGLVGGVLDIIKGSISWIAGALGFDAVEKFLDSFSFGDMFSSFVDALMFIPKKLQEVIMSPIESFKKLGSFISDAFKPISAAMGMLVDAALLIPKTLLELLNDYIIDPLSNAFKPVTTFFKSIAEKVMGFFEDFGIPEMGFSVLGKKFSIGPYYPFRPEQGTVRVASNADLKTTSGSTTSSSGEKGFENDEKFKKNIVSSGAGTVDEKTMRENGMSEEAIARSKARNKDETRVLATSAQMTEKIDKDGKSVNTFSNKQDFATFDPKTGKSMLHGDTVLDQREGTLGAGQESREISKRAFSKIKSNAQAGGDQSKIAEIVKEDDAYQKLSFFDKMKVDVGYAKAADLLVAASPTKTATAEKVSQQSSDNAVAKMPTQTAPSNNNIVNAPVTTNNKTTQLIKSPTRNQESSQTKYMDSRYVY